MIEYLGLDNRPLNHIEVICELCENIQWKMPAREGDKFA